MKPLKVYLCDLTHETVILVSDTIPVNIGYVGSYAKKIHSDLIEISLFKYPKVAIEAIKKNPPDVFFIYSSKSAKNLFDLINKYSLLNLVTNSNLMCISEKVLLVLKKIKWKKEFIFSPGEEEFLLRKIK